MAVITESKKVMDDSLDKVYIRFSLKGEGTLAERLFAEVEYIISRNDGLERRDSWRENVSDSISTFEAGDASDLRALLKKLYDAATDNI
jgi:hypothetical protein